MGQNPHSQLRNSTFSLPFHIKSTRGQRREQSGRNRKRGDSWGALWSPDTPVCLFIQGNSINFILQLGKLRYPHHLVLGQAIGRPKGACGVPLLEPIGFQTDPGQYSLAELVSERRWSGPRKEDSSGVPKPAPVRVGMDIEGSRTSAHHVNTWWTHGMSSRTQGLKCLW